MYTRKSIGSVKSVGSSLVQLRYTQNFFSIWTESVIWWWSQVSTVFRSDYTLKGDHSDITVSMITGHVCPPWKGDGLTCADLFMSPHIFQFRFSWHYCGNLLSKNKLRLRPSGSRNIPYKVMINHHWWQDMPYQETANLHQETLTLLWLSLGVFDCLCSWLSALLESKIL